MEGTHMITNFRRLPETSCIGDLNKGSIFQKEIDEVFSKVKQILSYHELEEQDGYKSTYINNIIGIIGMRGSGKSSILHSVINILKNNKERIPNVENNSYRLYCVSEPIDPKSSPDCVGILDLVIASLFSYFQDNISRFEDEKIEKIFQCFEELNKPISFLSIANRKDVIENPSDLYELATLTKLKSKLESLVDFLLSSISDNNDSNHSAFVISIDDFDLDTSSCHKMATEALTFLNIRGLVFLIAMDDIIFENEIERGFLRQLTDLGGATNTILKLETKDYPENKFDVGTLMEKANDYCTQLSIKFIPVDLRINIKTHELMDEYNPLIEKLSKWLFGFNREMLEKQKENLSYLSDFLMDFKNSLSLTLNLRARNQILNQIFDKISSDDTAFSRDSTEEIARLMRSYPVSTLGKNPAMIKNTGDAIINYLQDNFMTFTLLDNIGTSSKPVLISEIFEDVWNNHPCAVYAFNLIISEIHNSIQKKSSNIEAQNVLLRELIDILSFYATLDNPTDDIKNTIENLNTEIISHSFKNTIRYRLKEDIRKYKEEKTPKKNEIAKLVGDIEDGTKKLNNFNDDLIFNLRLSGARVSKIVPWKKETLEKRLALKQFGSVLDSILKEL